MNAYQKLEDIADPTNPNVGRQDNVVDMPRTADRWFVFGGSLGFWGTSNQWTTDRRFFQVMSFERAVTMCRARKSDPNMQCMPVPEFAVKAVRDDG